MAGNKWREVFGPTPSDLHSCQQWSTHHVSFVKFLMDDMFYFLKTVLPRWKTSLSSNPFFKLKHWAELHVFNEACVSINQTHDYHFTFRWFIATEALLHNENIHLLEKVFGTLWAWLGGLFWHDSFKCKMLYSCVADLDMISQIGLMKSRITTLLLLLLLPSSFTHTLLELVCNSRCRSTSS